MSINKANFLIFFKFTKKHKYALTFFKCLNIIIIFMDGCQSGLMCSLGKRVCRKAPQVRILCHPPKSKKIIKCWHRIRTSFDPCRADRKQVAPRLAVRFAFSLKTRYYLVFLTRRPCPIRQNQKNQTAVLCYLRHIFKCFCYSYLGTQEQCEAFSFIYGNTESA